MEQTLRSRLGATNDNDNEQPIFVGDGAPRRFGLRAAAVGCALACVLFVGAIFGGCTESDSVKAGPIGAVVR